MSAEPFYSGVALSSASDDWATPQDLYDRLHAVHGFTLDVCASHENAKCPHYFTAFDDGLAQRWIGVCWMNAPYGRGVTGKWVQKAAESALAGHCTVVCLLPSRTDVAWWHDWVIPYGEISFLRGRLKFGGAANCAPFPSAVVVFRRREVMG